MGKPFKMKGHTLPGINQRSEGDTDLPDGRSGSAPFQKKVSPIQQDEEPEGIVPEPYSKFVGEGVKISKKMANLKANEPPKDSRHYPDWKDAYKKASDEFHGQYGA